MRCWRGSWKAKGFELVETEDMSTEECEIGFSEIDANGDGRRSNRPSGVGYPRKPRFQLAFYIIDLDIYHNR